MVGPVAFIEYIAIKVAVIIIIKKSSLGTQTSRIKPKVSGFIAESAIAIVDHAAMVGGDVGGRKRVAVDVSGEPYVDLEREAQAMLMRE